MRRWSFVPAGQVLPTILATALTRTAVFLAMAVMTARLAEHERALLEREQALEKEAATLRSLLPICAGCRKIRDGNNWDTLEAYVSRRREEFGTDMCPTCARERFPEHFPPSSSDAIKGA